MDNYTIGLEVEYIFHFSECFLPKMKKCTFNFFQKSLWINPPRSAPCTSIHCFQSYFGSVTREDLCHKKSLSQEKIKTTLYIKSQHHLYICLNLVVNNSVENNVRIRKEQRWNTCGFTSLTKVLDGSVGEKNKERIAQFS